MRELFHTMNVRNVEQNQKQKKKKQKKHLIIPSHQRQPLPQTKNFFFLFPSSVWSIRAGLLSEFLT